VQTENLMDIISGNAGAIQALLEIYEILQEQTFYGLAIILGDELVLTVVKNSSSWSWHARANWIESPQHNLTGFSHGAAGIAYSLLGLFLRDGNNKYRVAAE